MFQNQGRRENLTRKSEFEDTELSFFQGDVYIYMYTSEKKQPSTLMFLPPKPQKIKVCAEFWRFFITLFLCFCLAVWVGKNHQIHPNLRVCPVIFCVACSSAKKRSPTYKASTKILKSETFAEPGAVVGGQGLKSGEVSECVPKATCPRFRAVKNVKGRLFRFLKELLFEEDN